jgi:hypothetical protein
MQDNSSLPENLNSVVSRYLRGEMQFDAAATELAGVLESLWQLSAAARQEPARPSGPVKIKPLTVEDWMKPPREGPIGEILHATALAPPAWSKEDRQRLRPLFEEALRRAERSAGGAV